MDRHRGLIWDETQRSGRSTVKDLHTRPWLRARDTHVPRNEDGKTKTAVVKH